MRHAFPVRIPHLSPYRTFRSSEIALNVRSGELLLDEERPQMGQLPCARSSQDHQLDHHPPNDAGVCSFRLVSELGFSFLVTVSLLRQVSDNIGHGVMWHTLWKTCSLRISCSRELRSLTLDWMSCSLSLSELSIALDSPMVMSRVSLMPPLGLEVLSQAVLPLSEDGVKQILWSPASCAVKV